MKNLICLLLVITLYAITDARTIKEFDLKGFLQRVIKTNLEDAQNPWKIGEVNTEKCRDEYDWCSYYKDHCSHPTVKTYCKKLCGSCPKEPEPTCKDKYNCGKLKKYCSYSQYKDYMTNYCPATCGLCGETLACGVAERRGSKADNPIVGGEDAKKGHYPWQAAIYFDGSFLCGGSLIDNKHVLTAAHCFKYLSTDLTMYKIVLGEHNRDADEGTEEERQVTSITQHESYQYESDTHDVAIMEMNKEVVFGADINAICLPNENEVLREGSKCFMSGWGKLHSGGSAVTRLQHVALPIVNRQHCVERNTFNSHTVNDRMICAGYNDGMNYQSGCHGDSGGPLACQQTDGSWKLYGITSWGSPQCNGLNRYTVFARVSKYTKWIKGQTS